MASYPPNFNDPGLIQFCTNAGQPANVDGFYAAINNATGNTNGSIDDVWKLYITNVLGYAFVGAHPAHYGLAFGDLLINFLTLPATALTRLAPGISTAETNALCGQDAYIYGYSAAYVSPTVQWGYSDVFEDATLGHVGFRNVSIRKNAYIESAILGLTFASVGVAWPGGKLYAKKISQNTIVGFDDSGYDWVAGGKLTTEYVSLPSSQTAGSVTLDVTNILLELMAAPDWVASNSYIQFMCIPDATCIDSTYALVHQKRTGTTIHPYLDVTLYDSAGNAETSAITSGYVFNYMPVSAADLAIADRIRFVVQDDTGSAREDGVIVPSDTTSPSFFSSTARNTTRKTVAVVGGSGLVELPSENWTVLPQARLFGRKYHNHADLLSGTGFVGSLGYTDGWRFLPEHYDYLFVISSEWEATDSLEWLWDVFDYTAYPTAQSFIGISANPATGDVTFDVNAGTRVTQVVPSMTAGAGRTIRIMLFWDHLAITWNWKIVVENSSRAIVTSSTGSAVSATVWDAELETVLGKNKKWLVGILMSPGSRYYGQASIEWQASASSIWESTADWMTKSWVRGIKSLDPRLMVS